MKRGLLSRDFLTALTQMRIRSAKYMLLPRGD
jgi:hypothetical protein